jgi:uncharacterized protein (DUF427 family)
MPRVTSSQAPSAHRIEVVPSDRHVRIEVDGEVVADSANPVELIEGNLPSRWYLPREDVRAEVLRPSDTRTRCPFKGEASYLSVVTAAGEHPDLVWYYPEPLPAVEAIRDRLCFYNEKVDLFLDGERQEQPRTRWS